MIEKHIVLEDIDPIMFYGVGNCHLQMVKSLFPKLRIMARGNVLRVLGDEEEIAKIEEDVESMRKHLLTHNTISEEDILDIVKGRKTASESSKGVIVYSMSGRPIKSKSENQQKLIDAYYENDMIFAVGPAGTGKTYLSIALANSLVESGKRVAFIKTNSFVTKMANYIKSDSDFYDNIISRISSADYVFFDDIGSEIVTAFSRDRLLMSILDYRMENRLCTIFTSNFDKKYLLRYYSGSQESMNARRLIERIDILGEDFCLTGTNKRRNLL